MPLARLITNILWLPILIASVWAVREFTDFPMWLAVVVGLFGGMVMVLGLAALSNVVFGGPDAMS